MASLIETLIDVLDKENTEYQGLLKLSEEKTTAIVNGNVERGKYIARMDADDIANVDRLKKQYEFMEVNKDIDLIGTSVDFIDENNSIIQKNY